MCLRPVVDVFEGANRTLSVIRRCPVVWLAYNVLAATLAITGVVNALQAAVLMPTASFTVLGMALWLRSFVYLLMPLAFALGGAAVWAFVRATRAGQFDDLETPAHRILHDDEPSTPDS